MCVSLPSTNLLADHTEVLSTVPESRVIPAVFQVYNAHIRTMDSAQAFSELTRMEEVALEEGSPSLRSCALFFKGKYCYDRHLWNDNKPLLYFEEASNLDDAPEVLQTEILFYKGIWYFFAAHNYPLAFEHLIKAHNAAEAIGYQQFPNADELLSNFSNAYYHFGELDKTILYLKQALSLPVSRKSNLIEIYNTLGLCYRDREHYDTSLTHCLSALEVASELRDSAWIGILAGNLGYIYYKLNRSDEALTYLLADYNISSNNNQGKSAANAALLISHIYFEKGDEDSASFMLDRGRQLVYATKDPRLFSLLYKDLAAFYKHRGDYEAALKFTDSFISYRDRVANDNDKTALERARNKAQTEAHLADIRLLESESHKQLLIRNGAIAMALLLIIAGWQTIRKIRLKQRKDMEILQLQKRHSEEELEHANTLLNTYMESIRQKNQLIEQFTAELDQLHNAPDGPIAQEKIETLRKLQEATILTDDDWIEFKTVFTRVHPTFFMQLNERFPSLTPAEIRILALTKLGLSVKEKANMLGISPDSVRRTQQRLNKKLGMTELQIFEELVPA